MFSVVPITKRGNCDLSSCTTSSHSSQSLNCWQRLESFLNSKSMGVFGGMLDLRANCFLGTLTISISIKFICSILPSYMYELYLLAAITMTNAMNNGILKLCIFFNSEYILQICHVILYFLSCLGMLAPTSLHLVLVKTAVLSLCHQHKGLIHATAIRKNRFFPSN